jgi:hypothetical protein
MGSPYLIRDGGLLAQIFVRKDSSHENQHSQVACLRPFIFHSRETGMRRIFRGSFQAAQAVVPSLMAPAAPEATDAASTPNNLAISSPTACCDSSSKQKFQSKLNNTHRRH